MALTSASNKTNSQIAFVINQSFYKDLPPYVFKDAIDLYKICTIIPLLAHWDMDLISSLCLIGHVEIRLIVSQLLLQSWERAALIHKVFLNNITKYKICIGATVNKPNAHSPCLLWYPTSCNKVTMEDDKVVQCYQCLSMISVEKLFSFGI